MKKKRKSFIKILSSWIVFSLLFQLGFYFLLNDKVEQIMAPSGSQEKIIELEAEIPGTSLENIQMSYNKEYLAYKENGTLKVFNLKLNKVVFEKKPPTDSDSNMGVIYYQWLPDRDTLVYFSAREMQYNNSQITELYTLELPPGGDQETEPQERLNRSIDGFPSGGKIAQMVVSTFTNLLYLSIETGWDFRLMEIDIMKNVRNLNNSGEEITQIAASDKFGTLYFKSKVGNSEQIMALQGDERTVVSNDPDEVILGNRSGTLFLGKVKGDYLVSIRSAQEASDDSNLSFTTLWEGSIPYHDVKGNIIGTNNKIIVYTNKQAYVIETGEVKEVDLSAQENIISLDGLEVIQLTREGMITKVKLQSLSQLVNE